MDEIFGLSMNVIMVALLILLGICLLTTLWIIFRRPVMFKLGLRNVPRRPAQTVLVIIGLMLSTLIIAAALGTGDTIDHSATAATYKSLGHADELVVYSQDESGEGSAESALNDTIPQSTVDEVESLFADSDLVDGVMPLLIENVPAFLFEGEPPSDSGELQAAALSGEVVQAEPTSNLVGIDPARVPDFGGLKSVDGSDIALEDLGQGEIVISEEMADDLGAEVGDWIGFAFENRPMTAQVTAIAEDSPLSGRYDQDTPGMVMPLARLQELTGKADLITMVAVSNKGGVRDSLQYTDAVVDRLREAFKGEPLGVDPIKQDLIDQAKESSSIFTTFFLIFGLFSIAVGILLIVLIFAMLAAERRPEMGMARAVGAQRAQLVHSFLSEGTIYALLAGFVGAALGVLAALSIGLALDRLFDEFFDIDPYVSLRSMVVAYCLGVVITFLAVVYASIRNSRLNIVAAIRDIPDVSSPVRKKRTLLYAAITLILGTLLTVAGLSGDTAFPFYFGMSIIPFGIASILRYFGVPSRPVYALVGFYLIVLWLLPESVTKKLFGTLDGDIEMFFLSGIFLVAGSTVFLVQTLFSSGALLPLRVRDFIHRVKTASVASWLLSFPRRLIGFLGRLWERAVERLAGGVLRTARPPLRTSVAFPRSAPSRAGMTVAMFSLIIFSLVMFTTINENFVNIFLGDDANAGWDVRADQGFSNPIGGGDDFLKLLEERGFDTSQIDAVGTGTTEFDGKVRQEGTEKWKTAFVHGMDNSLVTESKIFFQQRAEGYADDAAIIEALKSRDDVAVIDASALPENQFFSDVEDPFVLDDPDGNGPRKSLKQKDEVFPAIPIEIQGNEGQYLSFQIIGIIDSKVGSLIGLFARENAIQPILPNPSLTSYFMRLNDPENSTQVAKDIEKALLVNGVEAVSVKDELEDFQSQSRGFLYIIQGFMGLGLIVGLAAVGVIAFRAVVERRQQIGVLRAIGFQSGQVSLSFLIETAFIVALGTLSGTVLGLLLARNLFSTEDFAPSGVDFTVPWVQILVILILTFIAALLMTLIPARQASRLAPAEALRYE